jgi:hypothetical protein
VDAVVFNLLRLVVPGRVRRPSRAIPGGYVVRDANG